MKKIYLFLIALIFISTNIFAQKAETPDFEYKIDGRVETMRITDSGVLLLNGNNGLTGIKPGAATPHFEFKDYGKIKDEEMEFIPMTPYVVITQEKMMTTKKSIIDVVAGKVLFASEDNEWREVERVDIVMPDNKAIVAGLKRDGSKGVTIYDLATGKEDGFIEFYDGKKVTSAIRIPVVTGPATLIDGGLLIPTSRFLLRADLATGEILWENEDLKNMNRLTADESGKEIYCFQERNKDTRVHKVSSSGEILWKKEIKVQGEITRFQILPNGLAVVSDVKGSSTVFGPASESKIAFLSAADGSDLWSKAPKTKGYVQHFYIMDDGILFGLYNGGINKVSFDGKTLFKKPLKTGLNIRTMALTPQGMIYITNSDADIIDLNTGESVWGKPLTYKNADVVISDYDEFNDRFLIYDGKNIRTIDGKTGEVSTLAEIKFDGKETASRMMVREDGILVASSQNLSLLDFNGNVKFHKYYEAPGKSTAGKILAGVGGVALVAAGTAMTMSQAGQYGSRMARGGVGYYQLESYKASLNRTVNTFAGLAAASFVEMNRRFTATSATENYQFILTKLDNGDVGLIKLDNSNGNEVQQISLKDKKPEYEVDEIGGYLYYKANNSTIYSYDLNK